jgi:heptosyltransferase-3
MKKQFAIICAEGIGDGLITSIAAHNLRKQGHLVTLFSPHLHLFGSYLEPGNYLPLPQNFEEALKSFDAIILQFEDSKKAKEILSLRKKGFVIYLIYTNYRLSKHGPLDENFDFPVDETKPMVHNLCNAVKKLFHIEGSSQNCLPPRLETTHRKYQKRVLIHPTSSREDKNWRKKRFLKLGDKLEKLGFEPMFILSPKERTSWPENINAPHFESLEKLVPVIYESRFFIGNDSGPAHLASYYQIPHIIVAQGRQMPLWSTGWLPPRILTPPRLVPNIKKMRLREEKWAYFISTKRVVSAFLDLLEEEIQHPQHPLEM